MPGRSRTSIDEAFLDVHRQLRSLADVLMRSERAGHTLQPTAVVNETYLRLLASPPDSFRDEGHFMAIAANTLRRVLVDHARGRGAERRGGGAQRVELAEQPIEGGEIELMSAVAESIEALGAEDPRGARVVELRVFGGLTMEEIAAHLGVSKPTVERDWRFCRAWLEHRLQPDEPATEAPRRGGRA